MYTQCLFITITMIVRLRWNVMDNQKTDWSRARKIVPPLEQILLLLRQLQLIHHKPSKA